MNFLPKDCWQNFRWKSFYLNIFSVSSLYILSFFDYLLHTVTKFRRSPLLCNYLIFIYFFIQCLELILKVANYKPLMKQIYIKNHQKLLLNLLHHSPDHFLYTLQSFKFVFFILGFMVYDLKRGQLLYFFDREHFLSLQYWLYKSFLLLII